MMKKLIRVLAAALAAAVLLASASFASPLPDMDGAPPAGDGGFNLGDFVPGGGSSGPAKVYEAETFTDYTSVRNKEAVTILVDLGLLNGVGQADGSLAFEPAGDLNRGAMAKLAALAVTLISGEEIKGEAEFTDTAGRWSEDYVAFCADKGMIDGDGNGRFRPNDSVTGLELAKVLVAAMGVKDGLTGSGWEDNVRRAAQEKGLLEGISAGLGGAITRDDAARMICNALKASDGKSALPKLTVVSAGTYDKLTIGENELLAAPGKGVSLIVDGRNVDIERGKTYENVTVAVSSKNMVGDYNFRQGIYVGKDGYDADKSIAGLVSGTVGKTSAENVKISSSETGSRGQYAINGIYVGSGGTYTVKGAEIELNGNGCNDFVGYGSALMASGGTLVVDGAKVNNTGAVRTAAVVDKGGKLIVKNSELAVSDGDLPEDYVPTFVPGEMMECPWMTGGKGNNRATNLLGEDSIAAYINTTVTAEKWGVLSSDNCTRGNLVGINSTLQTTNTTSDGYGSLVIGSAKGTFYGTTVKVGGYGSYIMAGDITYGDSTAENVTKLNQELGLGLTGAEIAALGVKSSSIDAGRSAFLQTGAGNIDISGKTSITSKWAVFSIKGASSNITVDGSKGATLKSTEDNIILQMLDNDDPGAMDGSYEDKTTVPEKDAGHDLTKAEAGSDVLATFKDMTLEGDFFNGVRGDQTGGMFNPGKVLRNLLVTLDGSTLTGQVSASTTRHAGTVTEENYYELGHVTNTPCAAVNNGVLVELKNASKWTVTETSYLTSLTVGEGCTVSAPAGKTLTMTVDGVETAVAAGQTYTGAIVLTVK